MANTIEAPSLSLRLISNEDLLKVQKENSIERRHEMATEDFHNTIGTLEIIGSPEEYAKPKLGEVTVFAGKLAAQNWEA